MATILVFDGKQYRLPEGVTQEQGMLFLQEQALANMQPEPIAPPPQPMGTNPSVVGGVAEFANAANRGVADTLDFLTSPIQAIDNATGDNLPTFGGLLDQTPGGQGGFMDPGMARDIVRGAGNTVPAAASLMSVPAQTPLQAGRDIGSVRGAAEELLGFGSAQAPIAATTGKTAANRAVETADEFGYPISPGDRYDSKGMKLLESAIDATPVPFNPMHRLAGQQQQRINEAASEAVGLGPMDKIFRDDVGDIADELSTQFKNLALEDDLVVNEQFVDDLVDAGELAKTRLFEDPELQTTVDKIFDAVDNSGRLGAVEYQDLTSQLKGKIRDVWGVKSPDPEYADSLGEMVRSLDQLAEDSMNGPALARLKEARRKWRTLTQLEKSNSVKESGDVSGPKLANYLRRTDKTGYARGKNDTDLYNVAASSKAFPPRPDSGTAGRMLFQHPLLSSLAGIGGVGGATMAPEAALKVAAGAAATAGLGSAGANAYFYGVPLAVDAGKQMLKAAPSSLSRRSGLQANVLSDLIGWLEDEE